MKHSLLAAAATLLAACSGPARQNVPIPDQSVDVTHPEICRIYVARHQQAIGIVRNVRVLDGNVEVGEISEGRFLCWERRPGTAYLTLYYNVPEYGDVQSLVDAPCEAGEVLYYAIKIRMEDKKPICERLSDEDGRKLIANRKAAEGP